MHGRIEFGHNDPNHDMALRERMNVEERTRKASSDALDKMGEKIYELSVRKVNFGYVQYF